MTSAYFAAAGYEPILAEELALAGVAATWHGRLAISPHPPIAAAWALNIWTAPQEIPAPSIKAAADALRAIQRNWGGYAPLHHRRATLIEARLPPLRRGLLHFPHVPPTGHLGAWTLLAPDLMLASPTQTSPFVNGEIAFEEDHTGPPSRAYLKLWEACTRLGAWPQPGEQCLDLGASPGGWTWALAQLGARVLAIDRAPLDPAIAALPGVECRLGNAFGLVPAEIGPVDWLFSDIVAYPARLLEIVNAWIAAGTAARIVCTVKFQGATDHAAAGAFAAIPGGWLAHLSANKHELAFFWEKARGSAPGPR